jgi:hypothetical protein
MAVAVGVRVGPAALHPPPHLTDPARRPSWRCRVRSPRAECQPAQTTIPRRRRAQPGLADTAPPCPAPVSVHFQPAPGVQHARDHRSQSGHRWNRVNKARPRRTSGRWPARRTLWRGRAGRCNDNHCRSPSVNAPATPEIMSVIDVKVAVAMPARSTPSWQPEQATLRLAPAAAVAPRRPAVAALLPAGEQGSRPPRA